MYFCGYTERQLQKGTGDEKAAGEVLTFSVGPGGELVASASGMTELFAFTAQKTDHKLVVACGKNAEKEPGVRIGGKDNYPVSHGVSLMAGRRYFDMVQGFVVPIYHKFLYGVVKAWLNTVMPAKQVGVERRETAYILSSAKKKLVTACALRVRTPTDATRPYKDVVVHKGSYTMEDWGVFVGTFGRFVLGDAWDQDTPFYYMFALLSEAYHIFFQSHSFGTVE